MFFNPIVIIMGEGLEGNKKWCETPTKNKDLTYWQFRNQLQAMPNLQLIDNITIKIIKY